MTSTIHADKIMNSSGDQDSGVDLQTNDLVKIKVANSDRAFIDVNGQIGQYAADDLSSTTKKSTLYNTGSAFHIYASSNSGVNKAIDLHTNSTTGSAALKIDSSGYVFKPKQPFTFVRYNANTEDGAYNAGGNRNNIICKPTNVQINQGSHYSASTGKFTCPVAGIYEVSFGGNHYGNAVSNYLFIYIRKNGTDTDRIYTKVLTTDWQQLTRTSYISCAVNDELTITNENDGTSGGTTKGGWDIGAYSYFSFRLIG